MSLSYTVSPPTRPKATIPRVKTRSHRFQRPGCVVMRFPRISSGVFWVDRRLELLHVLDQRVLLIGREVEAVVVTRVGVAGNAHVVVEELATIGRRRRI